ncbi:MAG: VTT domain-containing protein [bacterium]|nr:VTT domain-containing protein [bacterium]
MFDLPTFLTHAGYVGLFLIVFSESGLFIGFLFPGDSLLFTAGFLASQGHLNIAIVVFLTMIGAIAGDTVGYAFGHHVGRKLFKRKNSIFFHQDHLKKAQRFYERHGGKTIILARFIPVIRTFAPIVAGMGSMKYSRFLTYNIIGGTLWAAGLSLLGYFLGSLIPNVDRYLLPIIFFIIVISILPGIIHLFRDPASRSLIFELSRRDIRNLFKQNK